MHAMKILAVDPGTRRIGLAACDEMEWTTRLLPALQEKSQGIWMRQVLDLVAAEGFACVLLGLPLNMDGSEGPGAKRSRDLALALEREIQRREISCQVQLWDERLTTFEAETRLRERGVAKGKAKTSLDSLAAQVLLEDFLRSRK